MTQNPADLKIEGNPQDERRPYYHVMADVSNWLTLEAALDARSRCENPYSDILLYEPTGNVGWNCRRVA